jgi:hypothetical protein
VNKEIDDVIDKLGVHAPPAAILDSVRDAALALRRELGLLQEGTTEAVPGTAAAPAPGGAGGGADRVLPDPA